MDAMIPQQVPSARFVLTYQQHNITRNVSQHLLSLSYADYLTGQADSLAVELEDTQGKWRDQWYPGHGDSLSLSIGWEGQPLRALGRFEIDEVELNCPPSTVTLHGLATGIKTALRTTHHHAYENTTLTAIARQIATRQRLQLIGNIQPIPLDRLTQQEADLTFLRNLAAEFDYAFKVTGQRLVFHAISELSNAAPVATLVLQDLSHVNLRDQIKTVPQSVELKHKDPSNKQLITYTLENGETVAAPSSASKTTTSGDTQKSRKRGTSIEASKARVAAELAKANRERTTGSWTAMGSPNLVSGNVVTLAAAGQLGGRYLITSSHHRITRTGGYTVHKHLCRVRTTHQEQTS
ncbi:phage late control D family protein [Pseudomonas mediterranea]|uniref:phage late control D family protein n=1 Tax=Pseudomonas mediterranea TaxID=183795 RepID=UPI0006D8C17B|nr:late control protein D [Pseudomonas mediterranea]MDU9028691.1 late control protein D [Pseudomonas mediterranea]